MAFQDLLRTEISALVERVAAAVAAQQEAATNLALAEAETRRKAVEDELEEARAALEHARSEVATLTSQLETATAERASLEHALRKVQDLLQRTERTGEDEIPSADDLRVDRPSQTSSVGNEGPQVGNDLSELHDYVTLLLNEVEYIYRADSSAGTEGIDLVERLTENLRCARETYVRRLDSAGVDNGGADFFDHQLNALIDAKTMTAFGRHLAIAAAAIANIESSASQAL